MGRMTPEEGRRTILEFILDEVPPSDNELYVVVRGAKRKRFLSDIGKAFKNGIKEKLKEAWERAGMPELRRDMMLEITVLCRFPHLFCKSSRAENAFVILDAHNRGKVLIDAIAEHFGLQDAQSFWSNLGKCEGPHATYVRIDEMQTQPEWPAWLEGNR